MSSGNGEREPEGDLDGKEPSGPSEQTVTAAAHIKNSAEMIEGIIGGEPGSRRIDRDPAGAIEQLADYWDVAAKEVRSVGPKSQIEVVPASVLLAEPEEDRSSHFRERFYYPAFGASCGAPRSGKGSILLWVSFCLAMGLPLASNLECVKPATAVFFTNEDNRRRIRSRVRSMALGAGVAFDDVRDLHLIAKPIPAIHLPEDLDALKRTLDPIEPKWIVIDGLSRISIGRDLNSDAEMQPVVEAVEQLLEHYGAAGELICHTTKANGGSGLYKIKGAGCVPAAADHLILFEREGDRSTLTFSDSRDDDDWTMSFLEERDEVGGLRYVLDTSPFPNLTGITGQAKPAKWTVQDRIAETVMRVHGEQRAGLSYDQIAGLLKIAPETVRKYVRTLRRVGRVEVVATSGGQEHEALVYPPKPPEIKR